MGGPLTVPQALNRYAATAVGQPGVAEATVTSWTEWLANDPVPSNIGKAAGVTAVGEAWQRVVQHTLSAYHRASYQRVPLWQTTTRRVPISQAVDEAILKIGTAGALLKGVVGAPPGSARAEFFALGSQWFLLTGRWNSRFITARSVSGYALRHHYPAARLAGRLGLWLKNPLVRDLGIGVALNAGYQAWLDYDNPYLTPTQYRRRWVIAGFAGGIGVGASATTAALLGGAVAGAFLGGPPVWAGIAVGTVVSIFLDQWVVPQIYQNVGATPQRNLAPMQE